MSTNPTSYNIDDEKTYILGLGKRRYPGVEPLTRKELLIRYRKALLGRTRWHTDHYKCEAFHLKTLLDFIDKEIANE